MTLCTAAVDTYGGGTLQDPCFGRVYLATNTANGKFYIGQTTQTVSHRWRHHKEAARAMSQFPFHKAIRKYGSEAFTVEELERCSCQEVLDQAEVEWIRKLHSTLKESGYNCTSGGGNGYVFTIEVRTRIATSQKKRLADPEVRKKMSEVARKQWQDPVFRQEASERSKRQFSDPEARCRLSESKKLWFKNNPEARTILSTFNRTPVARQAKSVTRKGFFRANPEVRRHFSEIQRKRLERNGVVLKSTVILRALTGKEGLLTSDIVKITGLSRKTVIEGLSRYKGVGLLQARALNRGELSEVVGRYRSRSKVWSLC